MDEEPDNPQIIRNSERIERGNENTLIYQEIRHSWKPEE